MNELEKTYISGKIKPEELQFLRDRLNNASDDEIAESLGEIWNGDIDESKVSQEQFERMRSRLDNTIANISLLKEDAVSRHPERKNIRTVGMRWLKIAAGLLLPILLVTTLYLYEERNALANSVIAFSTTKGERASVILPDGTKVTLNYDSKISYKPLTYNRGYREVYFEGEAYFDVAKNKDCPFLIDNKNLCVQVLGTKFNLSSRQKNPSATLALNEGSVRVSAVKSGISKDVKPGEVAVLDKQSGSIRVAMVDNIDAYKAWQSNEIVFSDTQLNHVIETLEDIYDIRIDVRSRKKIDGFNGTLPTNNLLQALNILRSAYGFRYTIEGQNITIVF